MNLPRRWIKGLALVIGLAAGAGRADDRDANGPPAGPAPLAEAARRMTVPDGFRVTLFAGEPDVRQPIAFTTDDRGRLWVAENFSYPAWRQQPTEKDRILIFEDADGDGRFDRRTVFWDQGSAVTGLALGFGGVFVCATPNLLFIPDRDGDDVPDGAPVVLLDGWDVKAQHNLFNGLNWGPDGWLYGCNGIMSNSRVGAPGTPDDRRVAINCGVWRYHPTRKTFEAVAHGTTNPWGLDFDDHGEAFITNCVIPHLFHVVPGARFQRMYGEDFNLHSYELMKSCADHIHWAGGAWQDSREGKGKHGEAGGGHAHTGAMVYLGDNWPETYRNTVFMCNLHGRRVNHDLLSSNGSSYVARHDRDFLRANDDWFRGLELKYGPDGGVLLTDWSDTGECHENDNDGAHRENGRIYKITYGEAKPARVDLARLKDIDLVKLQLHPNDWYVRHARRLLQERAAAGLDLSQAHAALRDLMTINRDETRQLRAVWALYVSGGLDGAGLVKLFDHDSEYVRGWAVRLLADAKDLAPEALAKFRALAETDPSPRVRLALASALQRLPLKSRKDVAAGLVAHGEDVNDPYLPLMIWYGVEPLVADDLAALSLAEQSRIPLVRRYLARRAVDVTGGPGRLLAVLGRSNDPAVQRDLLRGMLEALRGRKSAQAPEGWAAAFARLSKSSDWDVRQLATKLALLYGDPRAVALLRATAADAAAPAAERREALQALIEKRVPGLAPQLQELLGDREVRREALRGLAAYDDPATPRLILQRFGSLKDDERADAVNTLAARPSSALALLDAIGAGTVPARDLSPATARQLLALNDPRVRERLEQVWGSVRPTSKEKAALLAKYQRALTPERLRSADRSRGRLVFSKTCQQCHKLFDTGGDVGPDLTGSDRANRDYLLENILDPSATVGREYKMTVLATRDGRLLSGIVREQSGKTLVLQTVNERLVLDREEVEEMKPSDESMMPEGALDKLSADEVRDLFGYLASPTQVPLPEGEAK